MKKLLLFLSLFIFQTNYAQIDYNVLIDRLYSAADDSDGSGDEDPTWYLRMQDNAGGPLQNSPCYHTTHPYNSWYDVNSPWFSSTNTAATSFSTWMLSWEEDGCGGNCDYNPLNLNPFSSNFCANGEDGLAPPGSNGSTFGSTQTIDIFTNPPCTWNEDQISIFGEVENGAAAEYKAEIQIYWSPNGGVNPGAIAGNQTICSGISPSGLTSIDDGSGGSPTFGGYFSYQWEQDVGCTGAFTDITGANFNVYFPGAITQTTCFRRKTTSACGDFFSNSITITVENTSSSAGSLTASSNVLCSAGGTVDFTVNGGTLGAGAQWELYSGSCGGTLVATSATGLFSGISIPSTETYYVLANGSCNTTSCVSTTITVETLSTDPTSVTASDTLVCSGDLVVLNVAGGTLGTNSSWEWYSGSCGGTGEGNGSSITVSPADTTTYYVRAEGPCGNTLCASVEIAVIPPAISLDSALASDYTVCPEDPVQLTAYYSTSLPSNYIITWYTGACGAVPIGVGDNITVNPTDTTIYYVQCVGTCGVSSCDTVQVNVQDGSTSPGSITATNNNFCVGGNTTLTVNGGTLGLGAQWNWYEGSCASSVIGTGTSINVSPTASTMYYVRAVGSSCGPTACVSIFINIFDLTVNLTPFDTLCQFDSTSFILSGGTPIGGTYAGTGVTGGTFDPLAAGPGTHTITYSYTDPNGCSGNATEDLVIMESNAPPSAILASPAEICDGASSALWLGTVLGPDYGNDLLFDRMWVWYKGNCGSGTPIDTTYNNFYQTDASGAIVLDINGDTIFQDTSLVVSPSSTTNYYVRAEGGWCEPTECVGITISVYNLETNLLSFEDVCGVDAPTFDLTGGIPSGGVYSGAGVSDGVFDPLTAGLGTHTITYTYSYAGCTVTDSETITVSQSPVNVYHTIEQESCSEGGILIHLHTTGGSGFYSYLWSDGSVEAPLMYAEAGEYDVWVTDANDCTTYHGPIAIGEELGCIEMPNSFTPNGDGTNDTWNLDFSSYGSAQLTIYSKWGKIVAQFNDTYISWDGNYEGAALPAGTYYYILQLGNGVDQNGPITIVR
jgi:gliding motility-associated-like protein